MDGLPLTAATEGAETLWFALGTVGMAVGTAALAYGYRWIPERRRRRYSILVAVPLIATVAYALMWLAPELSALESADGEVVFWPRYLDWLLTTPLHILYLALIAGVSSAVIYRSLGLMAATIVFGFAGAMLAGVFQWALFAAGALVYAVLVFTILTEYDDAAATDDDTNAVYRNLRSFLLVLWLVYPVIWIGAPGGMAFATVAATAMVVSYLDVVAKVGFGLIALNAVRTEATAVAATEDGVEDAAAAD